METQMKFTELIREDLIFENLHAETKEEALTRMSTFLVEQGYCETTFPEAILAREAAHPSALPMEGVKIAIPHTDAEHVKKSAILFARLAQPIEFSSMGDPNEKLQVSLISMFALKEKTRIGDLLEMLISVYQDDTLLQSLCNAHTPQALYRLLYDKVKAYEN